MRTSAGVTWAIERGQKPDSRVAHSQVMAAPPSPRLRVQLGPLQLANPIMPASGCFGPQLAPLIPAHRLGAVVTKTVFGAVRSGNPAHRLTDVPNGMLNSVGIPSPGLVGFSAEVLPRYRALGSPVIVSIGGLSVRDYWELASGLENDQFEAFEVNVSCPNLEHGGLEIGADPVSLAQVTAGVCERAAGRAVIVKLSPNVASIAELARAAEAAGAAAVTVANTFVGMRLDVVSRRAVLGNGVGGLSGPSVLPLVMRLVCEASQAVAIPVIACGGINTVRDVAEYLIAGATAVQVGTATFTRPSTMTELVHELEPLLDSLGVERLVDLIGTLIADDRDIDG